MSNQQKSPLIRYRYDALDRLSGHRQLDNSDCQRFYCASHLVTEVQGDEQLSIVQHGDQLLAQQRRHGGGLDSALIATDQQRSVLNMLQAQCPRAISYSPYGHRNVESGSSSLLGFNGQRPDPVTGHYSLGNGYRVFNPVLMRFNSPDRLSPFGYGGLNAYAYCMGDPINRVDPTGNIPSVITRLYSAMKTTFNSVKRGHAVKPINKVMRLSDDIYAFDDVYKKQPRLTFVGHGTADLRFSLNDIESIDAFQLRDLALSSGIKIQDYANLRTVMCYSGNRMKDSFGRLREPFGDDLSFITGRPVKSYMDDVWSTGIQNDLKGLPVGHTYSKTYYFGVLKNKGIRQYVASSMGENYNPVKFDNKIGRRPL